MLCSVEIEPRTATFSAETLNLNTVTAHHLVTSERKYWPKFPFIVIGDVDSCQILQQISCINTSVLVASPSCPPWSAASENTLGLATQLGQNMISTARYLHALRPLIFALENVAALPRHPHWGWIKRLFCGLGYRFFHEATEDPVSVIPVARPRYMAILLRFDVFQQLSDSNVASSLRAIKMPLLQVPLKRCLWDLQQTLLRTELSLSDVEIQKLLDPRFVPQWNRNSIFRPADICKMRNCLESLKLESVMACYQTCLQFHDHQLAKGVFMQAKAFTVDNPHRVLWFALAPDEIAAALGVVHLGFDSLSNKEAYRLLGNMLVPVHSAFQWLRIAQIWTSVISNDLRLPQLEPFCQELAICSQAIQIHKDASATEPFIVWNLVEFPHLHCQVFCCEPTSAEIQDACDRILHVWNEDGTLLSTHFMNQALKHVRLVFWHGGMAICPAGVSVQFALDSLQQSTSWSNKHSVHLQLDLCTVAIARVIEVHSNSGFSAGAPLSHVQLCQNLITTQMALDKKDAPIFQLADRAIVCDVDDADFVKCANCLRDFEATALSALFGCSLRLRIPVFEDDKVGATLLPSGTGFGMDSFDTAILVNSRYFASFLDSHSLPISQSEAAYVYIDFDGSLLWKGFISPRQTLQTIVDAWVFANSVICIAPICRVVIAGSRNLR